MEFHPINRWPNHTHHLRNTEISLEVCNGRSYREIAKLYGVSSARVGQVYRILAGKLCERNFNIPYLKAVDDRSYTRHPQMREMMREYRFNYIKWMVDNVGPNTISTNGR